MYRDQGEILGDPHEKSEQRADEKVDHRDPDEMQSHELPPVT
jgi:hypothetical protein